MSQDLHDRILAAVADHTRDDGSVNSTTLAAQLDVARSTVRGHLTKLARAGRLGFEPVLPGFGIKKTSTQFDQDGEVEREWVQQTPIGEEFELPKGHAVKGVSALVDASGNLIQQWIKTHRDDPGVALLDAIKAEMQAYRGRSDPVPAPKPCNGDLLTIYPIADHHLGMLAWARETGIAYDLDIAQKVLIDAVSSLVGSAPASKTAIILNLGDFLHASNNQHRTPKSGNALDVDGRHQKVLRLAVRLHIVAAEMALTKHERVIIRCLPGNHDEDIAYALTVALELFFENNPRVTVDIDPSYFFFYQFGKVMLAATHGDKVRAEDMPGAMAAMQPVMWGLTKFRSAYTGHIHHKSKGGGEHHGATYESFQTLASKDAYHHSNGYSSGRSMTAITHHRERGEILRSTASI